MEYIADNNLNISIGLKYILLLTTVNYKKKIWINNLNDYYQVKL